jgi:hypothetical protein
MSFIQELMIALILTIFVEFPIYLVGVKKDPKMLLLYCILINSFTNPLFNYLYVYEIHEFYLLEIAIIMVEGVLIGLLAEVSFSRAIAVSVAANLASMIVGMLVFG